MRSTRFLLLASGLLLVACGDARLRKLSVGISKDSTMQIMGGRPERAEAYLTAGQMIEGLFYGKAGADSGTTPADQLTPVVLIDGKVTGWGQEAWEKVATEHNIEVTKPNK